MTIKVPTAPATGAEILISRPPAEKVNRVESLGVEPVVFAVVISNPNFDPVDSDSAPEAAVEAPFSELELETEDAKLAPNGAVEATPFEDLDLDTEYTGLEPDVVVDATPLPDCIQRTPPGFPWFGIEEVGLKVSTSQISSKE